MLRSVSSFIFARCAVLFYLVMRFFKEITIVKANPQAVFDFLVNIDRLYEVWHPIDHVFCRTLTRKLDREGCLFHFLEILGWFPFYLVVQVTSLDPNRYIEYRPIFPLSLLKLGFGYFQIEPISPEASRLTAYAEWGWRLPILATAFDVVSNLVVKEAVVKRHVREEGENLKSYVETRVGIGSSSAKRKLSGISDKFSALL